MVYNNHAKNNTEDTKMTQITKDMIIGDILDADRECAKFFLEIGMHCLGCPSARGETVEQACEVHGVDCDALVEKINDYLATK
jgi:hybrid cluster-associated redox disulfide protein